ncbi:hypothetical protein [Echinicola sp. 20G]|uniref:hypothetical protein n=1 Tax=Echinicola sp. 20G TaxID=2781961 RepID=UPI0019102C2E|nr:hypothetical protein [Echinicola sp. 20G]
MKIVRSWREQKILLKRMFPFLSDDDFIIDREDRNSMLDRLSKKLKKSRDELELLFAELQRY